MESSRRARRGVVRQAESVARGVEGGAHVVAWCTRRDWSTGRMEHIWGLHGYAQRQDVEPNVSVTLWSIFTCGTCMRMSIHIIYSYLTCAMFDEADYSSIHQPINQPTNQTIDICTCIHLYTCIYIYIYRLFLFNLVIYVCILLIIS